METDLKARNQEILEEAVERAVKADAVAAPARDRFIAAALTGLLASGQWSHCDQRQIALLAVSIGQTTLEARDEAAR